MSLRRLLVCSVVTLAGAGCAVAAPRDGSARVAVIPLHHQSAAELAPLLQRVSPSPRMPRPAAAASSPGPASSRRDLPVGDTIAMGDFRLRIVRVEGNDPESDVDETVVVSVRHKGETTEMTLRELSITEVGAYEIHVFHVVPAKNKPGHGTARIQVRRTGG